MIQAEFFATVPCMDRRCQQISSFNIDYCLMVCVDNVATKDDTIDICVSWSNLLVLVTLSRDSIAALQ